MTKSVNYKTSIVINYPDMVWYSVTVQCTYGNMYTVL